MRFNIDVTRWCSAAKKMAIYRGARNQRANDLGRPAAGFGLALLLFVISLGSSTATRAARPYALHDNACGPQGIGISLACAVR